MVLTVSFVLSPVTGLVCHRRPRIGFVQARLGRRNSANLTPASGRQDHTTSPYAATSFVSSPFDRSQAFRQPALQPRCAQNAAASTASLPASVTIMIRPSCGVGCESSRFDLGQREQIFFGKSERKDSTRLSANRPTGKSMDRAVRPATQKFQVYRAAGRLVRKPRFCDLSIASNNFRCPSQSRRYFR